MCFNYIFIFLKLGHPSEFLQLKLNDNNKCFTFNSSSIPTPDVSKQVSFTNYIV